MSQINSFFIIPPLDIALQFCVVSLHPDYWNGGYLFPQEFAGDEGIN
jgi:hypothetical protein